MRVALYYRVAHADQLSLNQQKNRLMCYATEQRLGHVECYADNGYSGLNYDRPGFSRMMADVEHGEIAQIVVQNVSRICRDSISLYTWLEEMKLRNVAVVSIQNAGMPAEPFNLYAELHRHIFATATEKPLSG